MKFFLLFFSMITTSNLLFSQYNNTPLNFESSSIKFDISSKEDKLIFISKSSEIAISDSLYTKWKITKSEKNRKDINGSFENINIFNKDTAIISGYLYDSKNKYQNILKTTDGGNNWNPINYNQEGLIDCAVNLNDGKIWLSVNGSGLAYSKDFGETWQKLKVNNKEQRYSEIFFNTKEEGLIGSLENKLEYTNDNGKTWIKLETPIDQKKYTKPNENYRSEFNKLAIYKNYFFVQQEDLVFYRNKDSSEWIFLKKCASFFTDPQNSTLFLQQKNGDLIKVDDSLSPIFKYRVMYGIFTITCKNENLYIISKDKIEKINKDNQIIQTKIESIDGAEVTLEYFGYKKNGHGIGNIGLEIFEETDYEKKIKKLLFTLPKVLEKSNISQYDENSMLCTLNDTLYLFDWEGKLKSTRNKLEILKTFEKSNLISITFENGSSGCFHYNKNQILYKKDGTVFNDPTDFSANGKGKKIKDYEEEINENEVNEFLKKLEQIFNSTKTTTISDLGFTEKEYSECKNDIEKFKNRQSGKYTTGEEKFYLNENNINYTLLLNLVDSVKNINPVELNYILLYLQEIYSTTSFWKQIELTNSKGDKLKIKSSFCQENAFYFPLVVTLNGLSIITTDIDINKFINNINPNFLDNHKKIDVLHKIVKQLYRQYNIEE